MAIAHVQPRTVAFFVESAFATPPADWDASGTEFFCIEPNVEALKQAIFENENYRQRPEGHHKMILGLKNGEFSFSAYLHGSPNTAAENAVSTSITITKLLKNAMGGENLGFAEGIAGGTAALPELDDVDNFEQGDFLFMTDATTNEGQFYRIRFVDTVTSGVLLDRDLHFTPDGGGADKAHAVIDNYYSKDALTDHTDSNHTTLSFFFKGEDSEDLFEASGCKLSLTIPAFEPGTGIMVEFAGNATTFNNENLVAPALATAPDGEAPGVVSTGNDTLVLLADATGSLETLETFSFEPTIGITHAPVVGPNGTEGRHGFVAQGFGATGLNMSVVYDDEFAEEFRAQRDKQAMIQVGNTANNAYAVFYPYLEYSENPSRGEASDLTSAELIFRARENQDIASGSLSGEDIEKFKSSVHVLFVA